DRSDGLPRSAPQTVRRGEDHPAASGRAGVAAAASREVRAGLPARTGTDAGARPVCPLRRARRNAKGRGVRPGDGRGDLPGLPTRTTARDNALEQDARDDPSLIGPRTSVARAAA